VPLLQLVSGQASLLIPLVGACFLRNWEFLGDTIISFGLGLEASMG
jgi:hypothetical protein